MHDDHAVARRTMVEEQIVRRGVTDVAVLDAMRTIPRERFLPSDVAAWAYEDAALPIGEGQTMSQPYIVALMAQAASLSPRDRVLEVGTGSGYAAAVLGQISAHVDTIERNPQLARQARRTLLALGYENVEVRIGDGSLGLPEAAPFDAIVVTAGAPQLPQALTAQLRIGGRLVVPCGPRRHQTLVRAVLSADGEPVQEDLGAVVFVPLIGEEGWPVPRRGGRGRA